MQPLGRAEQGFWLGGGCGGQTWVLGELKNKEEVPWGGAVDPGPGGFSLLLVSFLRPPAQVAAFRGPSQCLGTGSWLGQAVDPLQMLSSLLLLP